MPDWADTPGEIMTLTIGALTIAGLIMGGLAWLIRGQIAQGKVLGSNGISIVEAVHQVTIQLENLHQTVQENAGYARKDIDRVDAANAAQHEALAAAISQVERRQTEHIRDHLVQATQAKG
jgi:hypothetical protein